MRLIRHYGLILLLACLFSPTLWALSIQDREIKRETPKYILNIKYPQGFTHPGINLAVEKRIHQIKKGFMNSLADEADLPKDLPGKSGLTISYDIPFDSGDITSVKLNISTYNKGAAHPNNSVETLNFIKGRQLTYAQVFLPETDYLQRFANYSRGQLIKNKDFDKKWVTEGTEPKLDNYKIWYFSVQGITIVFDTYQVAAYVYGPQTVTIPLKEFKNLLRPEVRQAIWGDA